MSEQFAGIISTPRPIPLIHTRQEGVWQAFHLLYFVTVNGVLGIEKNELKVERRDRAQGFPHESSRISRINPGKNSEKGFPANRREFARIFLWAMGSDLTIQHLRLLGWVALQPLFIAVGVCPHYGVVRQPYRCRQFLQLLVTQTAAIRWQMVEDGHSKGQRSAVRNQEGRRRSDIKNANLKAENGNRKAVFPANPRELTRILSPTKRTTNLVFNSASRTLYTASQARIGMPRSLSPLLLAHKNIRGAH